MVTGEKFILVADDDVSTLELIEVRLNVEGYKVVVVKDGEAAWEVLHNRFTDIEAVLLDRCMPGVDGIELLQKIKQNEEMKDIPVILVNGMTEKEEVIEGIEAGAYYYLTKPFSKEILLSIVNAAVQDFRDGQTLKHDIQCNQRVISSIRECQLVFKDFEEIQDISVFISSLFPDPNRVAMGVQEMVRNAVEHGNLAITYDEKTKLIQDSKLIDEITKRQEMPEYKDKHVYLDFSSSEEKMTLHVRDEGTGFDWQNFMEVSPERVTDNHGRGIAMANLCCFDEIKYVGNGNEVYCSVHTDN